MAGISQDQRRLAWNVEFVSGLRTFAGIYQRDDFLTVADVARELDMCLSFPEPQGAWHAILLPMGTTRRATRVPATAGPSDAEPPLTNDNEPFILLDKTDSRPFPTPAAGHCAQYRYAFHSGSCNNPRHSGPTGILVAQPTPIFSHPFPYADACIREPGTPSRRRDPRYFPINKKSTDDRFRLIPARRNKRKASSSDVSPSSRAPSSSLAISDTNADLSNADIPVEIILPDQARSIISKFRTNVLTRGTTCAITRKGESWLGTNIGPGLEVAHIVPQCHWNSYPIKLNQGIANADIKPELEEAWRCTWSLSNGLPLLSHIHRCFEARLIAIHPITHCIRIFAWYDVLEEYHGQKANIPYDIDVSALQHHWDMCCFENSMIGSIPDAPIMPASVPPPMPTSLSTSSAGPQAALPPPTSTAGNSSSAALPTVPGQSSSGSKYDQHSLPCTPAHPLSPPSSDTVEHAMMRWTVGNEVIEDPLVVNQLRQMGWLVHELRGAARPKRWWMVGNQVIEDPQYAARLRENGWDVREIREEQSPTRPPKRQRSISQWKVGAHLIDDEYEAQRLQDQGWIVESLGEEHGIGKRVREEQVGEDDDGPVDRGRPCKRRSIRPEEAAPALDAALIDEEHVPVERESTVNRHSSSQQTATKLEADPVVDPT